VTLTAKELLALSKLAPDDRVAAWRHLDTLSTEEVVAETSRLLAKLDPLLSD